MGKRYDWKITQQNTPYFKELRMLFLIAMGIFVLNLITTGIFLPANLMWCVLGAVLVALFTGVQCFDIRREMWTWGYVIFWIVFSFAASAVLLFWYRAYWWFIGYGIELIAFIILTIWKIRKKTAKSRRR